MDNLSHSVAGLAVGELVHRCLPVEPDSARHSTRRRMLLIACTLASNFPDLDLFFKSLLPAPLGYLLHHRGHTHTLFFAIPQALLLLALIWLLWPAARRLLADSGRARGGLLLAVTLGFLMHLSMDFLNSYGIHPFYPFDPDWRFGDMVFILEPVFWVALGVPMIMMMPSRALKTLCLLAYAGIHLFFTAQGFLHWGSTLALLLVALVLARLPAQPALVAGLALTFAFIGMQAIGSHTARAMLTAELRERDPASVLTDSALNGYPANPLCWSYLNLERNEAAGTYRLRRGVLSLAPELLPASACPARFAQGALVQEKQYSLAALRQLAAGNCYMQAWLRFARMPAVDGHVVGDARFGATPMGNFSTMNLDAFARRACPDVPGWGMPRRDLLTR